MLFNISYGYSIDSIEQCLSGEGFNRVSTADSVYVYTNPYNPAVTGIYFICFKAC